MSKGLPIPPDETPLGTPSRANAPWAKAHGLIDFDVEALDWQEGAACAGANADLFFPERGQSTKEAKRICRGCEIRSTCLDWAIERGEKFGIWGGMSERERRAERRLRYLKEQDGQA